MQMYLEMPVPALKPWNVIYFEKFSVQKPMVQNNSPEKKKLKISNFSKKKALLKLFTFTMSDNKFLWVTANTQYHYQINGQLFWEDDLSSQRKEKNIPHP